MESAKARTITVLLLLVSMTMTASMSFASPFVSAFVSAQDGGATRPISIHSAPVRSTHGDDGPSSRKAAVTAGAVATGALADDPMDIADASGASDDSETEDEPPSSFEMDEVVHRSHFIDETASVKKRISWISLYASRDSDHLVHPPDASV